MKREIECPSCGRAVSVRQTPNVTVDIIIENRAPDSPGEIVLIRRRSGAKLWAIPGGYVDYGETLEQAAVREALEETGLHVTLVRQMHAYSDPARDPRHHNVSVVFIARAEGTPRGADDAEEARFFLPGNIPLPLAFDHEQILEDYLAKRY